MVRALVPLKDLVQAKTRLAGVLAPSERRALAQAMLEDVLMALAAQPDVEGVTLVSDDPCAHLLAAQYGAEHWPERGLGVRGLNAVLATASKRLLETFHQPLLVLHADLPLLAGADIAAAVRAQQEKGGLVIGCDRHGSGTNLLCFAKDSLPDFHFGDDSCALHRDAALAAGLAVTIVRRPGIGLDVDQPRDLLPLMEQLRARPGGHTAALLGDTELGARMRLALASLEPEQGRAQSYAIGRGNS